MKDLFITTAIVGMELTEEEVEMIMKKREKDTRRAKRDRYIEEMRDLLARAKEDGFTFGHNKTPTCSRINTVEAWGDAKESWIRLD
jgi:hypothetical protein